MNGVNAAVYSTSLSSPSVIIAVSMIETENLLYKRVKIHARLQRKMMLSIYEAIEGFGYFHIVWNNARHNDSLDTLITRDWDCHRRKTSCIMRSISVDCGNAQWGLLRMHDIKQPSTNFSEGKPYLRLLRSCGSKCHKCYTWQDLYTYTRVTGNNKNIRDCWTIVPKTIRNLVPVEKII